MSTNMNIAQNFQKQKQMEKVILFVKYGRQDLTTSIIQSDWQSTRPVMVLGKKLVLVQATGHTMTLQMLQLLSHRLLSMGFQIMEGSSSQAKLVIIGRIMLLRQPIP